jgi:hypothetical protein
MSQKPNVENLQMKGNRKILLVNEKRTMANSWKVAIKHYSYC